MNFANTHYWVMGEEDDNKYYALSTELIRSLRKEIK